jgi:hypothetical protein
LGSPGKHRQMHCVPFGRARRGALDAPGPGAVGSKITRVWVHGKRAEAGNSARKTRKTTKCRFQHSLDLGALLRHLQAVRLALWPPAAPRWARRRFRWTATLTFGAARPVKNCVGTLQLRDSSHPGRGPRGLSVRAKAKPKLRLLLVY